MSDLFFMVYESFADLLTFSSSFFSRIPLAWKLDNGKHQETKTTQNV
jgi:hypothetical protein